MSDLHAYPFLYYVFIAMFSILITLVTIPSILHIARTRHLYDDLGHFRKQHDHGVPRLGGVAIFLSFTITSLMFCMTERSLPINYLLTSSIILFTMGVKDDLSGMHTRTKFLVQFIVCSILVILGGIRLTTMYGIFGIFDLPYIPSVSLSILTIMFIVNSFNLIDGIDGLAAILGIIVNGTFAALFIYLDQYELAAISFAMVGAIIGFLRYNIPPAKIFMGDTGSLLIGLISAVMAIKFTEINTFVNGKPPEIYSAPALAVTILIVPIFDTLRVFIIRITNGVSPFKADRNHIHHRILRLGFTHLQTTLILAGINILSIGLALLFNKYSNSVLIVVICLISLIFNWMITFFIRCKERAGISFRNLFV